MKELKLISWNVNGLRAMLKKGFLDIFKDQQADIFGIQETKLQEHQLPDEVREPRGYHTSWCYAERKGYSGVGLFCKQPPDRVQNVFEAPILNGEGRVQAVEYGDLTVFNIYFPNGQLGDERLKYKLDFYDACLDYFDQLRAEGKKLVIMGDVNTAHKPIDLKNPKANEKYSGFLPIERAWMDKFTAAGYVDTFRLLNDQPDQYTWWSYRMKAREKNVGWRIDYFFVSDDLKDNVTDAYILPEVMGSDHCPIGLKIKI